MSDAVVKFEAAPMSQTDALLSIIERAARDPSVDIDKIERLAKMFEAAEARRAKTAYAAALAGMQIELPEVTEYGKIDLGKGKPQKYALWEDINEALRPVLARHGFSLSFRTGRTPDRVTVTGVLMHRDGHSEETTLELPIDASGSKNAVQAIGSSTSYGKRYTAGALLNFTSRGEDDDGAAGCRRREERHEELPASVRAYLEIALGKIEAFETAADLTKWWNDEKPQRLALGLGNTKDGPKPGYKQLFEAFSARGKELSQ
jgi:hypothetical protein